MTATPERPTPTAPHADSGDSGADDWANRSAFGSIRGTPWWGSVLLAVLMTALGTLVDVLVWSKPGVVFTCCYVLGSLLAITLVRRGSLFGPMVQPPLVLAVAMPVVVLAVGAGVPSGGGMTATVLAVASPLINGFPAMAITSAVVLGIGLLRVFVWERFTPREGGRTRPDDSEAKTKKAKPRPAAKKAAEGAKKRPAEGAAAQRRPAEGSARRPAPRSEGEQRPGRGAPGRGRPSESGGGPAKQPAPGKQRPKKPAAEQGTAGKQGAPRKQPPPGKQGARPRGQAPEGGQPRAPQQGGQQPGRPAPGRARGGEGKPQRGEQPPPARGTGPRQAPPGRGGKPPQRPPGDQPGRPRRPRRDNG